MVLQPLFTLPVLYHSLQQLINLIHVNFTGADEMISGMMSLVDSPQELLIEKMIFQKPTCSLALHSNPMEPSLSLKLLWKEEHPLLPSNIFIYMKCTRWSDTC